MIEYSFSSASAGKCWKVLRHRPCALLFTPFPFYSSHSNPLVRFEVFRVVTMKITVFRNVTPCSLVRACWHFAGKCAASISPTLLRNVSKLLTDYMTSHPKRQQSSQYLRQNRKSLTVFHAEGILCNVCKFENFRIKKVKIHCFLSFFTLLACRWRQHLLPNVGKLLPEYTTSHPGRQ
jgi:hypothetical protein